MPLPFQIVRLELWNFRGFERVDLVDLGDVALLAGVNASGKSSVLDACAVLLSRLATRVATGRVGGRLPSDLDVRTGTRGARCTILVRHGGQVYQWSTSRHWDGARGAVSPDGYLGLLDLGRTIADDLGNDGQAGIPAMVYYPVNRAVIDIPLRIRKRHVFSQLETYEGAFGGGTRNFRDFFEWFRQREDVENEQIRDAPKTRDPQLEAVRNAFQAMLPDCTDLRVRRQPLRMVLKKSGEDLWVNQLSDGEKVVLALVGDLARRLAIANPSSKDAIKEPGIVLIDEVDLHLHPAWQRSVVPNLRATFPSCQFVLTSHSPQVISSMRPEDVYLLADGAVEHPSASYGRQTDRILEDIMGVPARPEEVKSRLRDLFDSIDRKDMDRSHELYDRLQDDVGESDPSLVKARMLLRGLKERAVEAHRKGS